MSPGGRSEQVDVLRGAIARIAGGGGGGAACFSDPRGLVRQAALGENLALDRVLRGGLGRAALHEVVAAAPGDAAAAAGFALALATRCAEGRPIVWIVEDAVRAEHGAPYAPGLVAHGVDLARLIVVATANAQDSLWAMEEALKAAPGAVVAELWQLKPYDLTASRRLVLAAQRGATAGLVVAAGAPGLAARLSSAAATRFEVRAAPGPTLAAAGHRLPRPGRAACAVRLARIRAGPTGRDTAQGTVHDTGHDPGKFWPLVWDHAEAVFRDALPLAPSAAARDRPAA